MILPRGNLGIARSRPVPATLAPNCYRESVDLVMRKPPKMQYKISAFSKTQPTATIRPSHASGTQDIQGIANGRSRMPDSPESAGFFDATKNIQAKTEINDKRSDPAAIVPPLENLNASAIVSRPNVQALMRSAYGAVVAAARAVTKARRDRYSALSGSTPRHRDGV